MTTPLREAPKFEDITSPAFDTFAADAWKALEASAEALRGALGIAESQGWGFDQDEGILRFSKADGTSIEATAQILGSWDAITGTWEWAWNNPSVNADRTDDSRAARDYGASHDLAPLTTGTMRISSKNAQRVMAAAAHIAGAQDVHWGIAGRHVIAFGFRNARAGGPWTPKDEPAAAAAPAPEAGGTPALLALINALIMYVRGPIALSRTAPKPRGVHLTLLPGGEDERLPAILREATTSAERDLIARGFAPPLHAVNNISAKITSCVSLLEHPADGTTGFISTSVSAWAGASMTATFATRFADGWTLTTSNFPSVLRTPSRPKIDGARFAAVSDLGALYDIHRARVAERAKTVRVVPTSRGADPIAFEDRESREVQAFWVKKRYYRYLDGDRFQMTGLGATLAAWRGMFPWKQLTLWNHDRKARAILKRLGRA